MVDHPSPPRARRALACSVALRLGFWPGPNRNPLDRRPFDAGSSPRASNPGLRGLGERAQEREVRLAIARSEEPSPLLPMPLRTPCRPVDGASLAFLRFAFGVTVAVDALRALATGEVTRRFVDPVFHFSYPGLGWLEPWPGIGPYVHFVLLAIAGLALAFGLATRISAAATFVGLFAWFAWDAARYQNHPYLFCLLALLFAWLPGGRRGAEAVPAYALALMRFQLAVPFVFAGIAKCNADWLRGQPLTTWLAERSHLTGLGALAESGGLLVITGLAMSYAGLLFDLLIIPALLWKPTRAFAFGIGVVFHLTNAYLFDIGVFPWFLIAATTVFFEPDWPRRFGRARSVRPALDSTPRLGPLAGSAVALWVAIQLLVPLRPFFAEGDPSWTERGQRFAWRMKLREKTGFVHFRLVAPATATWRTLDPLAYLTEQQAAHMATQPELIAQFASYVVRTEREQGREVEVHGDVILSLNGRPWRRLVDPDVDLAAAPPR